MEWMLFLVFFQTGFTGLIGFLSPAAIRLSAEGRFIMSILLILSDKFRMDSISNIIFLDRIYPPN